MTKAWRRFLGYWLPRALVIGFALSLILPAPEYLHRLTPDKFVVWSARLSWSLGLTIAFLLLALVTGWLSRRFGRR